MREEEAIRILRKYAPSEELFKKIYTHTSFVRDLALEISLPVKCDRTFVATAAILHDIGRFNCPPKTCNSVKHGIVGSRILRKMGLKKHARVAERHIGAGITAEDIEKQKLPLPKRDFLPLTIEEKIVCYADKLTEYDHQITFEETLERFKKEIGPNIEKRFLKLRKDLHDAGMKKRY